MSFDIHEECAVIGVFGNAHAALMVKEGLFALQHRGQEAAGILSAGDNNNPLLVKNLGLVNEVFQAEVLAKFSGESAIGHVRYSTAGSDKPINAQPFLVLGTKYGFIGLAHNGNLLNTAELRKEIGCDGIAPESDSDSELILSLIATSTEENLDQAINATLKKIIGAFSLVILSPDALYGIRDPNGFRPLVIGEATENGYGHFTVLASETCAFGLVHASHIGEVHPGEIVKVSKQGILRTRYTEARNETYCIFEHVYFSRPDSTDEAGESMFSKRYAMGQRLSQEHPTTADIVVPVPDSGVPAAQGYAFHSGITYRSALVRNHYIGRTFIEPTQKLRDNGVRQKLNPITDLIKGKKVILVDDSLVRGTTSRKIVNMVRGAGAIEVHVKIACPPTMWPCYYGVDTPERNQLIAANYSIEEICKFIGADTLGYLSLPGLIECSGASRNYCTACYTGDYPKLVNVT
ncbi:MAG: amidophosphoribosyltransferase [Candidatus Doudnabacteria bacterium]|jgi:amidophosphoribosyltransferase